MSNRKKKTTKIQGSDHIESEFRKSKPEGADEQSPKARGKRKQDHYPWVDHQHTISRYRNASSLPSLAHQSSNGIGIEVHNYEGIEEASVFFAYGTTLLVGKSASGKTTLLDALPWCLYRGRCDSGLTITSDGSKPKTPVVVVVCRNLRCQREGTVLSVTDLSTGESTSGDAAESMVIKEFGTKDVFLAASYMKQKESGILVSGEAKEVWSVLTSLVFEDKPDEVIDALVAEEKEAKGLLEQKTLTYEVSKSILAKWSKQHAQITGEELLSANEQEAAASELKRKKEESVRLREKMAVQKESFKRAQQNKSILEQQKRQISQQTVDVLSRVSSLVCRSQAANFESATSPPL